MCSIKLSFSALIIIWFDTRQRRTEPEDTEGKCALLQHTQNHQLIRLSVQHNNQSNCILLNYLYLWRVETRRQLSTLDTKHKRKIYLGCLLPSHPTDRFLYCFRKAAGVRACTYVFSLQKHRDNWMTSPLIRRNVLPNSEKFRSLSFEYFGSLMWSW